MTGSRVLLVDDDAALLQALSETLRLKVPEAAVDACDSAQEALDRVAATDYDAVVTDIKMPGTDGLALLARIRSLRPDTPTLLITGHGEHDLAVRALRGGAYDFIQKPIDRDYFQASLARAIRTRQLARQVERQTRALERHASELERAVEARTRELREAHDVKDRLVARLAFLAAASARLSGSLDLEATLDALADLVVPELADWCLLETADGWPGPPGPVMRHVDPARAELGQKLRRGRPPDRDDPHGPPRVIRSGESELVADLGATLREPDAAGSGWLESAVALGLDAYLCVPLVSRGRTLGALCLGSAGSGRRVAPDDLALAEDLARRAATAIDNARLYVEAREAVRAREAFVARASHELRTPLTSVLGTVRLLKKAMVGTLRESPESLIDMASRNLSATLAFINDLLDVSKLASGQETLSLETVELADSVRRCLEVVAAQARERGVAVSVAVQDGLRLPADRLKVEQVLINLLSNAVKFSPAGGEVAVSVERDAGGVLLRVRDSGDGIAAEDLERIFEPFYQSGPRRPHRPRGTGLGLAICQHIVALHGGRIWAESHGPGRGATFNVRLPMEPAAGRSAA